MRLGSGALFVFRRENPKKVTAKIPREYFLSGWNFEHPSLNLEADAKIPCEAFCFTEPGRLAV
jgi:hypothetical protein